MLCRVEWQAVSDVSADRNAFEKWLFGRLHGLPILTYLLYLTGSIQQSHCLESNRFSASQVIPCSLWKPKVHLRVTTARHLFLRWARIIQSVPPTNFHWSSILILSCTKSHAPFHHLGPTKGSVQVRRHINPFGNNTRTILAGWNFPSHCWRHNSS
jgi:hypothetical protein